MVVNNLGRSSVLTSLEPGAPQDAPCESTLACDCWLLHIA